MFLEAIVLFDTVPGLICCTVVTTLTLPRVQEAMRFPLIVAGSTTQRGLYADFSQGTLDYHQVIWAPGLNVRCASGTGLGDVPGSGTSFSAGMVSHSEPPTNPVERERARARVCVCVCVSAVS